MKIIIGIIIYIILVIPFYALLRVADDDND